MGTERRTFCGPDIDIPSLARALADNFSREGYHIQIMPVPNSGFMVQAGKEDTFRKIAGMSSALTAVLTMEGEYVCVEMGGAKWADKGVAAGVGAFLFPPALITAGVGAFQQNQLKNKAWQFIEQYVRTNSAFGGSMALGGSMGFPPQSQRFQGGSMNPGGGPQGPKAPPPPVNMGAPSAGGPVCATCSQPLPVGSKFCQACGAPASKTCFRCGKNLAPEARFCNHCGSPVSA
jgi:hypothetical protein